MIRFMVKAAVVSGLLMVVGWWLIGVVVVVCLWRFCRWQREKVYAATSQAELEAQHRFLVQHGYFAGERRLGEYWTVNETHVAADDE